ncbi:MAG TPA: protein kinase [Actinomycetota bacterium]
MTPTVLGERYRLLERIASGGMGTVWRAEDTHLRRPVAVKVLNEGLSSDERFVERFRREAKAAAGLLHPNIAGVFDYGESDRRPFIVMELIEGETLAARLDRRGPFEPEEVARIGAGVAEALSAAHAAGIVHRDVKPANVMLTERGDAKVMDFGIAAPESGTGLTGTGMVMGTARYLSPEQAVGNAATPASDVYALGVVMYELLAGEPPFDRGTPLATAMAHVKEEPPPLRTVRPGVPANLASLVHRCLAKDPGERPGSASELAAHLRGDDERPAAVAGTAGPADATAVLPVLPATEAMPSGEAAAEREMAGPVFPPTAERRAVERRMARRSRSGPPAGGIPGESEARRRRTALLAGAVLAAVLLVVLVVALGSGPSTVHLTSFVGKDRGQALSAAHHQGVVAQFAEGASDAPVGTVFRQVPASGTEVEPGSTVILVLSTGPAGSGDVSPPEGSGESPGEHDKGHDKGKDKGKGPKH